MRPFKTLLKPIEPQLLKHTAKYGRYAGFELASKLAGIKDYMGFCNYIREVTGDENFGLHPNNPPRIRSSYWSLHQNLLQTFLSRVANLEKIAELEAENKELDQQIRLLEWKLIEARRNGSPASELMLGDLELCKI